MRILLMNHFPLTGSGSGVYTMNIARALIRHGHEACVIMPENEILPSPEDSGVHLHPVYFNTCTEDALDYNFPCFTTHPRSLQTFCDLTEEQLDAYEKAFRSAIEEEIERFKPNIIHCGHIWLHPSYAADYGIPLVITAHGTDLIGFRESKRFRADAIKAYDAAYRIIVISSGNGEIVTDIFEDSDKCLLIQNGFDPNIIFPENISVEDELAAFGIENKYETIISFAGKFTHFKGVDILLRAAHLYQREGVATLVAGDGELFDEMTELKNELGLDSVYFIHNLAHEDLRKLYCAASMSILPSRNEPFGLVAIEALACGTPVIASNQGGPLDIITPDVGLLFESEDHEDLARQVMRVLDGKVQFDPDTLIDYAVKKYSQDHSIETLIDVYKEAIAHHEHPSK